MGHAEGASGLIGLIKVLLMYEHRAMFPNFDFRDTPHTHIRNGQFTVLRKAIEWIPTPVSVSNFGFGGTNAFVIVSPGAKLPGAVKSSMDVLGPAFATCRHGIPAPSAWYARQRSLSNHEYFTLTCANGKWSKASPVVFVLDGQGSQWKGMGREMLKTSPVFRDTIERLARETDIPLMKMYEDGDQWFTKTGGVIGIVSYQLGMLAVLKEAGVKPDIFLGHSLGEIACAYLAGFQTEAEVMRVRLKFVRNSRVFWTEAAVLMYILLSQLMVMTFEARVNGSSRWMMPPRRFIMM